MDAAATAEDIRRVVGTVEGLGLQAHPIPGAQRTAVGLVGDGVELTGEQRRRGRGTGARHLLFTHLLVHQQQLGAEEVPAYRTEHDQRDDPRAAFHPSISLVRRCGLGADRSR